MAKITFNQLLDAIRGGIGNLVMRQRPDGTIILSGAPQVNKRKASPKQRAHREKVKRAAHYAKWADEIYPVYAELAKDGSGKWLSRYNMAFKDFMEAPVIHCIERADGCIRVRASDNVGVTRLRVTVLDEAGAVLDRGEGTRCEGDWWQFITPARGTMIRAEAWDMPENVAKLEAPSAPTGAPPPNPKGNVG
jgi:hypothetical protein